MHEKYRLFWLKGYRTGILGVDIISAMLSSALIYYRRELFYGSISVKAIKYS